MYLNIIEVAEFLGVSTRTVARLTKAGRLRRIIIAPKTIRYSEAEVKRYLRRGMEEVRNAE